MLKMIAVEIYCPYISIRVISTTENTARISIWAAKISYCCQIALTTIAIVATIFLSTAVVPVEGACILA